MTKSFIDHLECSRCGSVKPPESISGTCECGAPMLCRYDLGRLQKQLEPGQLAVRDASLWRYAELLPVRDLSNLVTLGEGFTPLLPLQWAMRYGLPRVRIKDEGQNPTGSFKSRGAAVSVTALRERGVREIVVSSSGNAGDAWAVYCRRAGIPVTIILPDDTPVATLTETSLAADRLATFGGHNSRGGRLARATAAARDAYNANTYLEPFRIEGKKTMGLELAEQLGWRLPDVVVYPIGGGVGFIGIWKAFAELLALGWVTGPMPRFYIAQYDGCAPFVEAFQNGRESCEPWETISTLPGGLRNAKSAGDVMVLRILRETGGGAIAVSTEAALDAVRDVMLSDGLFICPEAGTAIAAIRELAEAGDIRPEETVAVINTASGLKYGELFHVPLNRIDGDVEVVA